MLPKLTMCINIMSKIRMARMKSRLVYFSVWICFDAVFEKYQKIFGGFVEKEYLCGEFFNVTIL